MTHTSTYNFRLAQNNGMSEKDKPHYRNLVVKTNLKLWSRRSFGAE